MRIAALLLCSSLALAASNATAQEVSREKRAAIEHLMQVTNALALGQQLSGVFVSQLAPLVRSQNPGVPQHVIDAIPEEVNAVLAESLPAFKELVVVLYDKYFTLDELQGLGAFYSTPLGRKTIAVMPTVMEESVRTGMQWGRALGPRIAERIRARFKSENIKI
jgi:hypothetical protein